MSRKISPCPVCGHGIVAKGKTCTLRTPKFIRFLRFTFPVGVTCTKCGYYNRSIRKWNKLYEAREKPRPQKGTGFRAFDLEFVEDDNE